MDLLKKIIVSLNSLLLCFVLFLLSSNLKAQVYPVQISTQLIPPYSGYLPDYADPSSEKLKIILQFNDFLTPQYNVKLKLEIKGNGFTIVTKQLYNPPPIVLQPGIPTIISGVDLAPYLNSSNLDFIGINQAQYESRMALPEGFYSICVTAYDYYNPGKIQVSNQSCSNAWFTLSNPPFLNLPLCGKNITPQVPQNIVFQWTPVNIGSPNSATGTEYDFELWEVRPDSSANPNQVVLSTAPIFSTTTNLTLLNYGIAEPPLNLYMKYVWRVRARDLSGRDWFKNNGYSQICTFVYGNLSSVLGNALNLTLNANGITHRMGHCNWNTLSAYSNYKLQVRKLGTQNWFDYNTTGNFEKVNNLEPNTDYEARVRGESTSITGDWSNIATFRTLSEPVYGCGDQTYAPDAFSAQALPVAKAIPGLIIQTGQFEVKVSQITPNGQQGWYSGKGTAEVYGFPIAVKFNNIYIDDNNRHQQGIIEALTEGITAWTQQWDLQHAEENASYVPGKIDSIWVSNNQICVKIQGNDSCFTIPPNQNIIVVRDGEGNQYNVQVIPPPPKITGPFNCINYGNDNLEAKDSCMVQFEQSTNQQYGFDKKQYAAWLNNYETIKLNNGKTYYVAFKSVGENKNDKVIADIKIIPFDANKLSFKTRGGQACAHTSVVATSYEVTVPDDAGCVYAYYNGKKVGKLNVVSLKEQNRKLVLVPVNNANLIGSNLQSDLNKIFAQANVKWTITTKSSFNFNLGNDGLEAADANLLSKYSGEMRALRDAYKTYDSLYDKEAYYIFVVSNFNDPSVKGYMVRGRGLGFVAANASVKHVAHELAHGAFGLEHTFPSIVRETSNNLMDYKEQGVELSATQWEEIRKPGLFPSWLDTEENGSYQTDGHYSTIYLIGKMLGITQYKLLAWYTEYPDNMIHDKYAICRTTWSEADHQKATHALTYGYHSNEEFITSVALLNADENNFQELGRLLHRYGDCFAHTNLSDTSKSYLNKRMYGDTIYFGLNFNMTLDHFISDGSEPDLIANRPNWYLEYVKSVSELLSLKFQKNNQMLNLNIFEKLANYAKSKSVSLIGIIDYEIAILENKKEYYIRYPKKLAADANQVIGTFDINSQQSEFSKLIQNAENYLKHYNIQYTKIINYEQSTSQYVLPKIESCKIILK